MKQRDIPRFSELPVMANGLRSSWGVFGPEDDIGTANFLTPEAVAAAADEIRTGERVNVCLPLDLPNPGYFHRGEIRHSVFDLDEVMRDDVIDNFYLQGSTQWDTLRHVRAPGLGFYNGVDPEQAGAGRRLAVDALAQGGIVGRGVLVDIARYGDLADYEPTEPISIGVCDLERTLAAQGQTLREGDILLLHTGYIDSYLEADDDERVEMSRALAAPGLEASQDVAEFLWDSRISAVVGDNIGVEVMPPKTAATPILHVQLIPMLGMIIGEMFDFGALSAVCAADGRYSCFFAAVPLNLPRGVGSPGNAVAIR